MASAGRPNETALATRLLMLFEYLRQQGLFATRSDEETEASISVSAVAKHFGCPEEEVVKLVNNLSCCGQDIFLYVPVYLDDGIIYGSSFEELSQPLRLSLAECKALISALDLTGVPQQSELRKELLSKTATPAFSSHTLENYKPGIDIEQEESLSSKLVDISSAIEEHRYLQFAYRKWESNELERRRVEPISLMLDNGKWYLEAYCLSRDDTRTFAVENMTFLFRSSHSFEPRDIQMRKFSDQLKGEIPYARLRFNGSFPVENREWPGIQVEEKHDDGSIIAKIPFTGSNWLPWHIIARLGAVEVLEPASLKDSVACLARKQRESSYETLEKWKGLLKSDEFQLLDTSGLSQEKVDSLMARLQGTLSHSA